MYEKKFKTFISGPSKLETDIIEWLKQNNLREIDRSAPAFIVDSSFRYSDTTIVVGVTVTAEKYVG